MKTGAILLGAALFIGFAGPAVADDCLRQGEFALSLALRLHIEARAEGEAVSHLAGIGIEPAAGWKPAALLREQAAGEVDRAVVLAYAEGRIKKGSPSAVRAVLAVVSMSEGCWAAYRDDGTVPGPVPVPDGVAMSPPKAPQSRKSAALDVEAADPEPPEKDERPGINDPEPGKKPVPISPHIPENPPRPGPGTR